MSPAAYSYDTPVLTAQRGGLAPTAAPVKMHPSEIALTLSADVLRLPYPPATRLVLAEIISLYAANAGCCDASDPHFAARLTINKDTVSVAIAKLEADGLVSKVVVPVQGGKYRTLTPRPAAIAAKAATNAYPEVEVNTRRNFRRVQDGNSGLHTPEIPDSHAGNSGLHTPEIPAPHAGNSGGNTPFNIPSNLPVNPTPSAHASEAAEEKKIAEDFSPPLPANEVRIVPPVAKPPRAKPAKTSEPEHFAEFWQAWPKKEKRQDAVAAFAKLSPEDQAAAASRADAWLTARPDLAEPARHRFIPHPTTWLNQARWTDQAPALASSTHAAPSQTVYPSRPVNGHKPLGHGGTLARFLAEQP